MSSVSRGRGYTGKHQREEIGRPGLGVKTPPIDVQPDVEFIGPMANRTVANVPSEPEREPPSCVQNYDLNDDPEIKELLYIDDNYASLLLLLEQFNPGEDGIQFNRKLKHFETTIGAMCPDQNKLIEAFSTFHAAALQNTATARKLSTVGTSFTRQQKRQVLRNALLIVMQTCFSKLDVLERSNPQYLINATNVIGDYFAEGRLMNGEKIVILAPPIVQYMKSLLKCNDLKAHKTLAAQLMQNGRDLFSLKNKEIEELSIAIRVRLLDPPSKSSIWLLLCSDLCLNKFLPLPQSLQQFYAEQLHLVDEGNSGYSEVDFGSWKKDAVDAVSGYMAQTTVHDDDSKPKLRPILGAGAGLLRQDPNPPEEPQPPQQEFKPSPLSKRYDLNSWRQNGGQEPTEDVELAQGDGSFIHNQGGTHDGEAKVENWRKEDDRKVVVNKKFSQQDSKESLHEDDEKNRRNRRKSEADRQRRHVSDVPRSQKYWDHDDRCDIDYNS